VRYSGSPKQRTRVLKHPLQGYHSESISESGSGSYKVMLESGFDTVGEYIIVTYELPDATIYPSLITALRVHGTTSADLPRQRSPVRLDISIFLRDQ
jgi:hypothetical protein